MLLIDPLALFFILFPALAHLAQTGNFFLRGGWEQVPIHTRIEQPVPILARNVRDEPSKAFSVEANLGREPRLDQKVGIHAIAIELKAGIVEDKVNPTALEIEDRVAELVKIITEDVLFRRSQVFAARRLEFLDVFFGHLWSGKTGVVSELIGHTLMSKLRSVELPHKQTWVNSRNIRRIASAWFSPEGILWSVAKRVESSNTACDERENVSHFWRKKTSLGRG